MDCENDFFTQLRNRVIYEFKFVIFRNISVIKIQFVFYIIDLIKNFE